MGTDFIRIRHHDDVPQLFRGLLGEVLQRRDNGVVLAKLSNGIIATFVDDEIDRIEREAHDE